MKLLEKLKTNRKFKIVVLILLTFMVPYITIPCLLIWWFYKKSHFSRKSKIIVSIVTFGLFTSFWTLVAIAYNKDTEPHLSVSEPSTGTHVQAQSITIKGNFDPNDRKVWINGKRITTSNGNFETTIELKERTNLIKVSAGDWKRATTNLTIYKDLTEEEKVASIIPTPTPESSKQPQQAAVTQGTPTPPSQPTPTTPPDVTEDYVRTALTKTNNIIYKDSLVKVEIFDNLGTEDNDTDKIVNVYFQPLSVWDEKDAVRQSAEKAVKSMKVLFTNPQITQVVFWTLSTFTDSYGNDSQETTLRVGLSSTTANKINWDNFIPLVQVDYQKLFDIADVKYVHPSIAKTLDWNWR